MKLPRFLCVAVFSLCLAAAGSVHAEDRPWVVYEGKEGPGKGKSIVLLSGDEEYRSEEGLPELAKILAEEHGFKCTVVFSINPKTGEIDPGTKNNEPGLEALDSADLCIMLLRFREWPDEQMKHFVDFVNAGKPIIALRTATHAFSYNGKSESPYKKYSYNAKEWPGGFGKQVLGETWVNHWGSHKHQATKGIIEPGAESDPILRGVKDIFGTTDVYEAHPPADVKVLVRGQVLTGMNPTDPALEGPKNSPMQPIVWTRSWTGESGKTNKILTTTMGAATDLENEDLRRLLVNGVYSFLGMEVPAKAKVDIIGDYKPSFYGFGGQKKGTMPKSLQ